jgi:hypothetical protein
MEYIKTVIADVECLIKCGACCFDMCDKHTIFGCSLPREARPMECNAYLCGDGTLALYEKRME